MACSVEFSSSSELAAAGSDLLLIDPFLNYINEILMDEAAVDDDAALLQQVDGASAYQAIFSSLQDIISSDFAAVRRHGQDVIDATNVHQSMYCLDEKVATPMDPTIPCCGKDGAVNAQGQKGLQQEQGNGTLIKVRPATAEAQVSSSSELEFSFQDLRLDDVYTSLYVKELSSSTNDLAAQDRRHRHNIGDKMPGRRRHSMSEATPSFGDVKEVLVSCAQAVAMGDARRAHELLQDLHQVFGASENGTGLQRIAYIFSKALVARMRGMGAQEFKLMSVNAPSSAAVLRASKVEFEVIPYRKLTHYFANQSILKAAEGASRLHILDYGILYGLQWPCLINALADREGGPPLLVITGVEAPQAGIDMAKRLEESGQRLATYAKLYNVPFQYHAIVTAKWEDLNAAFLHCSKAEVLVVNSNKRLHHLPDDSVEDSGSTISVRQKFLTLCVRNLNPHLLVTTVVSASHNSPFFVSRFGEALNYYSNVFDMLDTLWPGDVPERLVMERRYYHRYIMSTVACEGAQRVERPETYKRWHAHITRAGFEQLPIPATVLARSKLHVRNHYHKEFLVHQDDEKKGWMLIGWKGRTMLAISAWKPTT